ncbi:hypothetical protein BDY19DRAFT_898280 [Irpex rosettiformis]|uniref:Uncharacterized protein n=1 Tax=Irpex rosettiformis TaxID=378272 RepID=A0ACB8TRE0_9APHY|nr:hypothetical protein BDY19DRAFT_898280 [Irpex rosettiformis]
MANAKEKHYWSQLRAALTSGSWDVHSPAQVPKGGPLSWSEMLRKFNKHCQGYSDVAELASQTQAISLLLIAQDEDKPSKSPIAFGEECTLPQERVEEATAGYATLRSLRTAEKDPVKLCLAYYAFALGRPSECLSILETVKELTDVSTRVLSYNTMHEDGGSLQLPDSVASSSTSRTGSFVSVWTTGSAGTPAEIADGRSWGMIEAVRSITLQGMSQELLSPGSPEKAFSAYAPVVPLITAVVGELQSYFNTPGNALAPTFPKYRELWRWTERALRRAIILAAQLCDLSKVEEDEYSLWTLFDLYRACSAHWPPTFRPHLRSSIAIIQSRAFVLRTDAIPSDILKAKAPRWIISARSVLQEFRSLLNVCTHFPRAGERNSPVEDFVDLCVAVWEADGAVGEQAGWVIDLLWWATRLTFNSFRIYRHMSRLFSASGDRELAMRTLRLYIQVVSKARQAATSGNDNEETSGVDTSSDFDTDRQWVQTLVQGSRLLSRVALEESDYGKRVDLAREAGETVQKAKSRLDPEDTGLVASVHLAEGVWYSVTAYVEQDPRTRTERLTRSIESLITAIGTFPTASAHHHLALALTRPGPTKDFQEAIQHARSAVELDSAEPRHWHLLGLLLAAVGDWKAAKSVLEIGIGLVEAELVEEGDPGDSAVVRDDGLNIQDFARSQLHPANGSADVSTRGCEHILPRDVSDIPPSATLLKPVEDRPRPTHQERFEYALQMRMSQLALTEYVDGVENVSEKWLDVFAWFREKRPASLDDQRKSIDGRRPSQDTRQTDAASFSAQPPRASFSAARPEEATNDMLSDDHSVPTPIPITVTPATPGVSQEDYRASSPISSPINGTNGEKRSTSLDEKDRDASRGKKVRNVLKSGVHKGQARMVTISKKIGHGVGRSASLNLKRINSAPDFHSVLGHIPLQASSIHLRQYQSIHASQQDLALLEVPPPPRAPSPDPASKHPPNTRSSHDARLLSDLWLMSAAIFRRQGKIEQVRGAIQEAEVRDEDNPNVWVQLGLYHIAVSDHYRASEAFRKALFINPDHVPATIYLCQIYLTPKTSSSTQEEKKADEQQVDLAAGLLSDLTNGPGWDVPEAWYYLAKAYKLQGRRDRERECLNIALTLSQTRGVRDITTAVGWGL